MKRFLFVLFILIVGALVFVMVHDHETLPGVWKRFRDFGEQLTRPKAAPTPAPTLAPTPEATPTPEPTATPIPTATPAPTPTPDPLAWLAEHKEHAPQQVALLEAAEFPAVLSGKVVGSTKVPAGSKVAVVKIDAETVDVVFQGGGKRLPHQATNLLELAKLEMAKAKALAVAESSQVTASGTQRPLPKTGFGTRGRAVANGKFLHPGIPLTKEDLEQLKQNIKREPWKSGFQQLASDAHSKIDYKMRGPFEETSRTPNVHLGEYTNDMQAVYNLARMWVLTGDENLARKGHDIMLAWATTHQRWSGAESYLTMGDFAYRMYGGADILRGTWPGWTRADTNTCQRYFEKVFAWAGTAPKPLRSANQGILQLVSGVCLAVFNDDVEKFNDCLKTFREDAVGGLANSLPNGEAGDMGRDQGHSYGQLLNFAFIAEVFWKQGVDVFSELDNRVLAVGEYYTRFNLGIPTPWVPFGTKYDYFIKHGGEPEGSKRPADVLNLIQGAYVVRKGLSAPYVTRYRDERGENADSFVFRKTTDGSTAASPPALRLPAATASVTKGLQDRDLGEARPRGSSSYANGVWTVKGGGSDIGSNSDSFHFTYQQVTGDFTLIANVATMSSDTAKAGLALRDSLEPDAERRVYFGISPEPKGLVDIHLRGYTADSHGNPDEATHDQATLPQWFKLQRIGSRITIFHSGDGGSWTPGQNAEYADWTGNAYVGLVVCSKDNGNATTVTFEDVRITGGDDEEAPKLPAAPFAIYGSPGDKQVPLRWLESFGATTYHVKRATTSRGPYNTVAKVNGTSCLDDTVTNGQTYYYVVSALNSAGESSDSPEEIVKPVTNK